MKTFTFTQKHFLKSPQSKWKCQYKSSPTIITCVKPIFLFQETISILNILLQISDPLKMNIYVFPGGVHVWEQTLARPRGFHNQQCGVLDISLVDWLLCIARTKLTFLLPATAFIQASRLCFRLSVNSVLSVVILVCRLYLKTTFVRSLKYIFCPFVTFCSYRRICHARFLIMRSLTGL